MTEENVFEWGKKLMTEKSWVLHLPTRVVGRVVNFFDGQDSFSFSSDSKGFVEGPVIALEQGHTFVGKPENFMVLSIEEVKFFLGTQQIMNEAIKQLVKMGAEMGVNLPKIALLLMGTLKSQMLALNPSSADALA